jgi:hypothetical protein
VRDRQRFVHVLRGHDEDADDSFLPLRERPVDDDRAPAFAHRLAPLGAEPLDEDELSGLAEAIGPSKEVVARAAWSSGRATSESPW